MVLVDISHHGKLDCPVSEVPLPTSRPDGLPKTGPHVMDSSSTLSSHNNKLACRRKKLGLNALPLSETDTLKHPKIRAAWLAVSVRENMQGLGCPTHIHKP